MLSKSYLKVRPLRDKLFFTIADVAALLKIKRQSARTDSFRYEREGLFVRLKNDMYVMEERWRNFQREDYFAIAAYLQVPSYISFSTALSFYGVTTQVQQDFIECACLKRTRTFTPGSNVFNYYKLKKGVYGGFVRKDGYFIATAEKAFLDSLYLYSFGKYAIDLAALDLGKLDMKAIKKQLKGYPEKTRKIVSKICKI